MVHWFIIVYVAISIVLGIYLNRNGIVNIEFDQEWYNSLNSIDKFLSAAMSSLIIVSISIPVALFKFGS